MRRRFTLSNTGSKSSVPLYFEALEDGFTLTLFQPYEYRIGENGEWVALASYTNSPEINTGEKIFIRANLSVFGESGLMVFDYITKKCNVGGNPLSLQSIKTLFRYSFSYLFSGCSGIVDASNLYLPDTVEVACYQYMFYGCTNLTAAPELPATTLAESCYRFMFYGCTSLTTAPELPATTLANYCYQYMFYGCSKLNYIKMLATNISANSCLMSWVYGVASSGTFVKHPDMTTLSTGIDGIPSGWTVVNDGEESGGGAINKIVNHGVLTIAQGSKSYVATIVFDFPCASTISIHITGSVGTSTEGISEGNISHHFTGLGKFQSFTYSPTEDDTYIYEITIEQ